MIPTLRSIGAVLAGYLVFAVSGALLFMLTGWDPHAAAPVGVIVLSTLYGITFALLAGYLATSLAGRAPLGHAIAVAGLIGLGAIVSMVMSAAGAALWSQLSALVLMAPSAAFGGLIRQGRLSG